MRIFVLSLILSVGLAFLSRIWVPIGEEAFPLSLAVGIELSGLLTNAFCRIRGLSVSVGIQWWGIQGLCDIAAFVLTVVVLSEAGLEGIFLAILLGFGVLAIHVTALVKVIRAIRKHHLANDKTACVMLMIQNLLLVFMFLCE
jgi:hypothetical protein